MQPLQNCIGPTDPTNKALTGVGAAVGGQALVIKTTMIFY